ncbi:thymidine phosphorylase family protein [Adhaeribacter terreus]|uniref:thymidine phosphorylase n=1 Tax=Adhaeribacter terreus TaxID=529703 RepID=A0ABW0EFK4_9BACT
MDFINPDHTSWPANILKVHAIGIDTYLENVIYLRADCEVCKSEGFKALTRVVVSFREVEIVATLNVVYSELIHHNEAGLSQIAMKRLNVQNGDLVRIDHLDPVNSLGLVRSKMYGNELAEEAYQQIIHDIVKGRYSNIEVAAFITACSANNLTIPEITGLTKAMIFSGKRLNWNKDMVPDKHCVGGLPGNRTTPIVVSILAAAGLTIPKTSSKAITSPAGTADVISTFTNANLTLEELQYVVQKENGCMAWGGGVHLSPADDLLITVEKALDVDSEGQMIASVLSKKVAAGATHVVIDIPVGKTAKVRSAEEAEVIRQKMEAVAAAINLKLKVVLTDGSQPVGRGIGPALEALDVLAVLRNEENAPEDLRERAVMLAAEMLEISGTVGQGQGKVRASEILLSGEAYQKFLRICKAQGGFREPVVGKFTFEVLSTVFGKVLEIDNRKLARIAKLAGAPKAKGAGMLFLSPLGREIQVGDVLFTLYAEAEGELEYAKEFLSNLNEVLVIG